MLPKVPEKPETPKYVAPPWDRNDKYWEDQWLIGVLEEENRIWCPGDADYAAIMEVMP